LDTLVEARELLLGMAFRSGRYQDALLQAQQILAIKPDAKDVTDILPTLKVLAPFVRQTVVSRGASMVGFELVDQNLVLPVAIDGRAANYILDNGFSLSGMSESEAKRLKLSVHTVSTEIDTASGAAVNVRIAVVHDLVLGRVHLRNVAFYVLPDDQPPFKDRAPGHRGILGLPVVLALEHFAWQPASGTFRIFASASQGPAPGANLAFDGSNVFTELIFRGRAIDVNLDTGAQNTVLYPSFAKQFPDLQEHSTTEEHRVIGVGGSASMKSFTLPSLEFQLGGVDVALKPATVLLEESNSTSAWFRGNLGMDLLNQARRVDVDFGSMTLSLNLLDLL
jgi:predicted aspartyl protease